MLSFWTKVNLFSGQARAETIFNSGHCLPCTPGFVAELKHQQRFDYISLILGEAAFRVFKNNLRIFLSSKSEKGLRILRLRKAFGILNKRKVFEH